METDSLTFVVLDVVEVYPVDRLHNVLRDKSREDFTKA